MSENLRSLGMIKVNSVSKNDLERQVGQFNHLYLGDNCIQILHLGRYVIGYTSQMLFYGVPPPK